MKNLDASFIEANGIADFEEKITNIAIDITDPAKKRAVLLTRDLIVAIQKNLLDGVEKNPDTIATAIMEATDAFTGAFATCFGELVDPSKIRTLAFSTSDLIHKMLLLKLKIYAAMLIQLRESKEEADASA